MGNVEIDCNLEIQKLLDEQQAEELVADVTHKAEGYSHKLKIQMRPEFGNDYEKVVYCKGEPSEQQILHLMRNSLAKTDFTIKEL